jgi:hypothetical protein
MSIHSANTMYDFCILNLVVHKVTIRIYKVKMPGVCDGGDTLRSDMTNWGVLQSIVAVSKTSSLYFSVCEVIPVLEEELG